MKKIASKDIVKAIEHWEKMLAAYKEQASRGYIEVSDYLPLWLGASNQECVDWIEDELKMLRKIQRRRNERSQ